MPLAHRIALKGPWRYHWVAEQGRQDGAEARPYEQLERVQMPTDWATMFGAQVGRVRFLRRFHSPTGIEPADRVVLCFTGVGGSAAFRLNEQYLGGASHSREPVSFDVTALLAPTDMLEVVIDYDPQEHGPQGGLWGTVYIEIHSGS